MSHLSNSPCSFTILHLVMSLTSLLLPFYVRITRFTKTPSSSVNLVSLPPTLTFALHYTLPQFLAKIHSTSTLPNPPSHSWTFVAIFFCNSKFQHISARILSFPGKGTPCYIFFTGVRVSFLMTPFSLPTFSLPPQTIAVFSLISSGAIKVMKYTPTMNKVHIHNVFLLHHYTHLPVYLVIPTSVTACCLLM